MTEKSEIVQSDDVLSFEEDQDKKIVVFIEDIINTLEISTLFRSDAFINALIEKINFLDDVKPMIKEGIPCQMMTPRRQGWIKGKVKLSLKFIPDEVNKTENLQTPFSSESPLDEIRNTSI